MDYYYEPSTENPNFLHIDDQMRDYLDEYGKWGKILAIISFCGIGLVVLAMAGGFLYFSTSGREPMLDFTVILIGIFYLVMMLVYFIPTLYLYRSSVAVREAVELDDDFALRDSFRNLKNLIKFITVLSLIGIALYGVLIVAALIFGLGSMMVL